MCYDADEPHLDAYDGNLEHVHLQPLEEMPGLLTPTRVLKAVRRRRSSTDLQKHAAPAGDLVPTSLGGDRRVLAMTNLGLDGAPFVSGRLAEAVQDLHTGEVALGRRHSHEARLFGLGRDGAYTLLDGDRGHRTSDQRPHLPTPSSAA
jgi:gentisate 1,2-dioxygenase